MLPNDELYELFTGILFFEGGEHIPDDLPVNLTDIREWAEQSGLIFDPDQLMNRERFEDISQLCSKEDELLIGLSLSDKHGSLVYVEYPYIPVKSLIRRNQDVKLSWWYANERETKFAFWIGECIEEFCSLSTATLVIPAFNVLLDKTMDECGVALYPDGSREVVAEGMFSARFIKSGRLFDVDFQRMKH